MLPSELSNFCRNHFHVEVPLEVFVPDIPRYIDYVPEKLFLKSMYHGYVALFCVSHDTGLNVCL